MRQRSVMVEFRWIKMSLFLILVLPFTGALSRQRLPSIAVRAGHEVTLPCENVIGGQHHCNGTTWIFSNSRTSTLELIRLGMAQENAKSGRLSVSADCSLVIKKVTDQDVGHYTCRQFISGQQGPESQVDLSVINMTEHVNNGNITLFCSVLKYEACRHTVKWMIKTGSVWEVWSVNTRSTMITRSTCSVVASFPTSHPLYTPNYESLKCSVKDKQSGQEQRCSFSPQSLCEKTAVTESPPSVLARLGHNVTLPCKHVMDTQRHCDGTTWIFSDSTNAAAVELVKLGQIGEKAKSKSDRLSLTANCSLVIKKVTAEDVGRYDYEQYMSDKKRLVHQSQVELSVINMTEHRNTSVVTFNCSVLTHGRCSHTVKWQWINSDVTEDEKQMIKISQTDCSETVSVLASHFIYSERFNYLKCKVTGTKGRANQVFPLRPETSGEDATISDETMIKSVIPTTKPNKASTSLRDLWWLFIVVAVCLVTLVIAAVAVIRRRRTKGNRRNMDDHAGLNFNPAGPQSAPGTSPDTADPEDGVSYAIISHTKKTNSNARVRDEGDSDAVTYSTVKASSSSAGASADPSHLYATVNISNK